MMVMQHFYIAMCHRKFWFTKSCCGDSILRLSYLHSGISYTINATSLYCNVPQEVLVYLAWLLFVGDSGAGDCSVGPFGDEVVSWWVISVAQVIAVCGSCLVGDCSAAGIVLCMHPANERRRYIVTSSLIGWAHTQNDPWCSVSDHSIVVHAVSPLRWHFVPTRVARFPIDWPLIFWVINAMLGRWAACWNHCTETGGTCHHWRGGKAVVTTAYRLAIGLLGDQCHARRGGLTACWNCCTKRAQICNIGRDCHDDSLPPLRSCQGCHIDNSCVA